MLSNHFAALARMKAAGGGGGPYDSDIDYRFDTAASYMTKDGGERVSNWEDYDGASMDLAQLTGSLQPLWVDNAKNGNPIVRLDGSGDLMTKSGISLAFPATFIVAVKTTSFNLNQQMFNGGAWQIYDSPSTPNLAIAAPGFSGYDSASRGDWHIVVAKLDGASSYLQIDGGTKQTGTANASSTTVLNLGLGSYDADFGDIFGYGAGLTDEQVGQTFDFLNSKYAIGL